MKQAICAALVMACAHAPQPAGEALPRIEHYDTREMRHVWVSRTVSQMAANTYRVSMLEQLETALCFYGRVKADTVFITHAVRADMLRRTAMSVEFTFPQIDFGCHDAQGFVGTWHSHLPIPDVLVIASPQDQLAWFHDQRAIMLFVGVGFTEEGDVRVYWQLRDGRYGYMRWASE